MSKVSEAKSLQGFREKWQPSFCVYCKFFSIDRITENTSYGHVYVKEMKRRCLRGAFAVRKQSTCDQFVRSGP